MEKTYRIGSQRLFLQWLGALTFLALICIVPVRAGVALYRNVNPIGSDLVNWSVYLLVVAIFASTVLLVVAIAKKMFLSPMLRCSAIIIAEGEIKLISLFGRILLVITGDVKVKCSKGGLTIDWHTNDARKSFTLEKFLFSKNDFTEIRASLIEKYG